MRPIHVAHTDRRLDLNLVYVAEALYRHLNVSRAAEQLGVTQSAVSHALGKLRAHFGDPLFARVSRGVQPTETAQALRGAIEELAEQGRELARRPRAFEPARIQGRFTIGTTDYVEVLLVPRLLARLQREAPGLQLSVRPTGSGLPKTQLESGAFDVACAGFYRQLPEGFFQQKLFSDSFAVACRKGHPLARVPLTKERFLAADHALITLEGDFKTTGGRRLVYGSYSFTGMAWTLARTDLLLTAPRLLLEAYRERFPIRILDNPLPRPELEIRMIWHALTHHDPAKRWLRALLKEELSALGSTARPPR